MSRVASTLVLFEGVRSAELVMSSGTAGAITFSAASPALRVAISGASSASFACRRRSSDRSLLGRSPRMRRSNSARSCWRGVECAPPALVLRACRVSRLAPGRQDFVRHDERLVGPVKRLARAGDFGRAQRLAMRLAGARPRRRARIRSSSCRRSASACPSAWRARQARRIAVGSWPSIRLAFQPAPNNAPIWSTESASDVLPSIEMPLSS